MKPTYSYPTPIFKSLSKCSFMFMAAIAIISFFASCTADEIEYQPKNEAGFQSRNEAGFQSKNEVIEENFLRPNDSIINGPDSNTTIIPPINPPSVPTPPIKP